jgi:uncharacterized membrane protein
MIFPLTSAGSKGDDRYTCKDAETRKKRRQQIMNYSLKLGESPRIELTGLKEPIAQAYEILHWGFTIAPILAGADKFFHLLCDWDKYLAPQVANMLPFSGRTFMLIVGVIEIVAGIGVMLLPRIFAYVVSAWLVGIILNLLIAGAYFDVALRDLGLALAALALGRLAASVRKTG